MLTHQEAFWLQFIMVVGTILAPIFAVIITIWYQNREAKRKAQIGVFMDLISFRNHIPLPWQFFVALNRIDIVFHQEKNICQLWHEFYELHTVENTDAIQTRRDEKKAQLLSAIANYLGYRNIEQVFLQRYYQTQGSYDEWLLDAELKQKALNYFGKGESFYDILLQNAQNQQASDNQSQTHDQSTS